MELRILFATRTALVVFPTEFEKSYLVQFKFLISVELLNAPDVCVPDDPGTE